MRTGRSFIGLEPTGSTGAEPPLAATSWQVRLDSHLAGGASDALFGGSGTAIAVAALEAVTQRPPIWVTTQFVSSSARGRVLSVEASTSVEGRSVSQAEVTVRDEMGVVVRALGAAGHRREALRADPGERPDAPPPDGCEVVVRGEGAGSVHDHVEVRMARGMFGFVGTGTPSGDNRSLQWLRIPGVQHDAVAVGLLGDFMLSALGNAVAQIAGAVSLDNTVRFTGPIEPDDDWLLLDSSMHVVANGLATGTGFLWHRNGELLAVVSQSSTAIAIDPTVA